jgi:hypothetical protein
MAKSTCTSAPPTTPASTERDRSTADIGSTPTPGAIFEPFSWLPTSMRGNRSAEFIARTRDVCIGVQACLQIAHSEGMDLDAEEESLLSANQTEHLVMLATQAVAMLAEEADREIANFNRRAEAEVAK